MVIHTILSTEDAEVLKDYCDNNHVTISAIMKVLVTDFLDTSNKEHVKNITNEAKKIKPGRPRVYY